MREENVAERSRCAASIMILAVHRCTAIASVESNDSRHSTAEISDVAGSMARVTDLINDIVLSWKPP